VPDLGTTESTTLVRPLRRNASMIDALLYPPCALAKISPMPSADEVMGLVEKSRSRIEQDRAYLRRLARQLAETDTVIVRAAQAYTISRWLLDKVDGLARNAPDADQDEKSFRSV
jgi:hypothetical protein